MQHGFSNQQRYWTSNDENAIWYDHEHSNWKISERHSLGTTYTQAAGEGVCSVCEVEITPVIDNTFEFPAFDAETP